MDKETSQIRKWLDKRFVMGLKDGKYFSHQPIYGYLRGPTEGRDLIRYARILSNLKKISSFSFGNFIDIGGAEGYTAHLVRKIFNVESYTCDLSSEANLRAQELFGLNSAGIDLSNLPFKDEAFDIVLCSEVLEHVTKPIQAIHELKRIAKKALIITTEAMCYDKLERSLRMLLVDLKEDHADRNWYTIDDFFTLLSNDIAYENTIPASPLFNRKGYSVDEVKGILRTCDNHNRFEREGIGASILFAKERPDKPEGMDVDVLVDAILNTTVDIEYTKNIKQGQARSDDWICILRCPKCLGLTIKEKDSVVCQSCRKRYKNERGVPLMYTDEADDVYLAQKWGRTYRNIYGPDNKEFIALKTLFESKGANPTVRFLAGLLLKSKERISYFSKLTAGRSATDSLSQLLKDVKRKIRREALRVIGRLRKLKASDLNIGDSVEFVRDYSLPGKDGVFAQKGTVGRISAILSDRINIKVEGIGETVSLRSDRSGIGKNEIDYVKKPLGELG